MTVPLTKCILDTDILIWLLRGKKGIVEQIDKLSYKSSLSISVISVAEIYKNIFPSELATTEALLDSHAIIPVSTGIAKQAGLYFQEYHIKLKKLSLTDCLIASTSLVHDSALITLNTKHFPMQNITVLDPKDI